MVVYKQFGVLFGIPFVLADAGIEIVYPPFPELVRRLEAAPFQKHLKGQQPPIYLSLRKSPLFADFLFEGQFFCNSPLAFVSFHLADDEEELISNESLIFIREDF